MLSDDQAAALVDAIDRNTAQVRLLRESLCGKAAVDRVGGVLGEVVDQAMSGRFHGRGHGRGGPV